MSSSYSIPRPTKRKSSASKKSAVTILNADASNFRALVQQLTGRPSTAPTRLRAHKGSLNINFTKSKDVDERVRNSTMFQFGYSKYYQPCIEQKQDVIFEHNDDVMSSSNGGNREPSFPMTCSEPSMNWNELDDVGVEKCLKELEWVTTTNVDNADL